MKNLASLISVLAEFALLATSPCWAATVTPVYTFPSTPNAPSKPIASLLAYQGALYGTTEYGGTKNFGVAFKFVPKRNKAVIIHEFGKHNMPDGLNPIAALIESGGLLYGTTPGGGKYYSGAAFSIDPATGDEKVLQNFSKHSGTMPDGALLADNGLLYGTASDSQRSTGTFFQIDLSTDILTVLHRFRYADGIQPMVGAVRLGQSLYGVLSEGGANEVGSIFKFNIATQKVDTVHMFGPWPTDAAEVITPLIAFGKRLYGTSNMTGAYNGGVVYMYDPETKTDSIIYNFSGQQNGDGAQPYGGLVAFGGLLYGTTSIGGANNLGTVYSINPATGAETVLYSFNGAADGANPSGALVQLKGALYGCASTGGNDNHGALFRLDP